MGIGRQLGVVKIMTSSVETKPGTASRLLIVDDSAVTRYRLRKFFTDLGYELEEACDGMEAIETLKKYRPDLILMDIHMPHMDGLTACAKIKKVHGSRQVPIIMITTLDQEELIDQAFELGAVDYITKPIHWPVLRNRVDYLLRAKKAETALFEEKETAQATLKSIGDAVITTAADGKVKCLNPVAETMTGWLEADAYGHLLSDIYLVVDEQSRKPAVDIIDRCLRGDKIILDDNLLLRKNNIEIALQETATPIHNTEGKVIGAVLVFRDVSIQRKQAKEMSYQASHDVLTGLINRREFEIRAERSLSNLQAEDSEHALMFMDLDKFKIINDTCGHAAGDDVLKQITQLMLTKIRDRDGLARLGGDEFALLLENCRLFNALKVAEKIRRGIQDYKYIWEGKSFSLGVSIGITRIGKDNKVLADVLSSADAACYDAKSAGRNCVRVADAGNPIEAEAE